MRCGIAREKYDCYEIPGRNLFMSHRVFIILLIMTMVMSCAKPSIILQNYRSEQIVHYSQIKDIDDMVNQVVYLDKGDKIPVKITLDSELVNFDQEDFNLILKQKVYFRLKFPEGINTEKISAMSEQDKQNYLKNIKIYLSVDAKKWALYSDFKAVKQVLGIENGSFSVGMGITEEDGVKMFINAKTNSL